MDNLTEEFNYAIERSKALEKRPSNDKLLALYSLFKQATVGDVSGKRPGMTAMRDRAKFDAWAKRKGMSQDDAKTAYIALVDQLEELDG